MDDKDKIDAAMKGIEDTTARPGTAEKKKIYALHAATGATHADAAVAAGYDRKNARHRGYEMSLDPAVQEAIDALKAYSGIKVTEQLVTDMLMKEAMTAGSSRDRREAAHLLGKTKAMFRDVQETTEHKDNKEFVETCRTQFGDEVADKMEQELGLTG